MSDLSRRSFLQRTGLGALSVPLLPDLALGAEAGHPVGSAPAQRGESMIGAYGPWAAARIPEPPLLSFRREEWRDVDQWRATARERLVARLARPETGGAPRVTVRRTYSFDDLQVEELFWQLPYGPPTEAVLLKPRDARGRLPAVLALHDHSGDKYFGLEKITRTGADQHPLMVTHQANMYEGRAWANELARLGYAVLVPDAFAFGSRRVRVADVPERIRRGVPTHEPRTPEEIAAYNTWASGHEAIMAKSLFSAGTTWPGVFLAEDQRALDVLCARDDVDPERVACGGLSGGGLRTVYLAGVDDRIRCAVCMGWMTTWADLVLDRSHTHTWMVYIPLLPDELEYAEILGLMAPRPALVQNNREDALFTLSEMERADRILGDLYRKAGATDRYRASFHPGPHKFDLAMQEEAFAWLQRWL
jgi:dienelactone hydrolase